VKNLGLAFRPFLISQNPKGQNKLITTLIYPSLFSCQENTITAEKINMKVKFCLKMKKALVGTISVDYLEINWQEDLNQEQLAGRFNTWLYDESFIEQRLPDLKEAAYCQLMIDPS
jgi:hypothetical protein